MSVIQTNSRWWELWVWIRGSKRRIGKIHARGLCCRHKSIIGHVPLCHFWRVTRQSLFTQSQAQTSVLCPACCRLTTFQLWFSQLSFPSGFSTRHRAMLRALCCRLSASTRWDDKNLVDPASSHMLVSKIKPCMSQYKLLYGETANGSLKQL